MGEDGGDGVRLCMGEDGGEGVRLRMGDDIVEGVDLTIVYGVQLKRHYFTIVSYFVYL